MSDMEKNTVDEHTAVEEAVVEQKAEEAVTADSRIDESTAEKEQSKAE